MCPGGEMNDRVDGSEMPRPGCLRADFPERAELDPRDRLSRATRQADHPMAAFDQPAAERAADEAGGSGHQNLRQPRSSAARPARDYASDLAGNALKMPLSQSKASPPEWPCRHRRQSSSFW